MTGRLRRSVNVTKTVAEVEGVLIEDAPVKSKASQRSISAPVELIDRLAEHLRRTGRQEPRDLVFQAPEGGPVGDQRISRSVITRVRVL
jgi:hypothetical protein